MRPILAAFAAALALPGAACAQQVPPPSAPPVAGGWSAAAVSPEVEAAAVFAFNALDIPGAELLEIENVSQQVVAGINYRMDLVLTGHRRWRVQVWRKLDGSHELTGAEEVKPHH
jgi:hypothetical protein